MGDMLPSAHYESLLKRVPPVWDKAFEINASESAAVRASAWSSCWLDFMPLTASAGLSGMVL